MTNRKLRPLLLLEMNEVPWRLVDHFKGDPAFPNLRRFMSTSRTHTTRSHDTGELSPWVTWPSLHRGMTNEQHGIRNLGQDPSTFKGEAIWEVYRRHGASIGICGSMQSWPPADPGEGGFFIPDTFAHDETCIPARVEPFQRFNLGQVRKNGRIVERSRLSLESVRLAMSLPRIGVRASTLLKVAAQVAGERVDATKVARRPVFQTILMWDVFRHLYNTASPPAFATFFSNHVAGIMHRFWHDVFPGDFGDRYARRVPVHLATMRFALGVMDDILGDALSFQEKNPEIIVAVASSMGQGPVSRDEHEGVEAAVQDVMMLAGAIGVPRSECSPLLAMVPQVAIEIDNPSLLKRAETALRECVTDSGRALFRTDPVGKSLNITILTPSRADIAAGGFRRQTVPDRLIRWIEAGIRFLEVEPGTGYHIPEGILAFRGSGIPPDESRGVMAATQVKPLLLAMGGLVGESDPLHRHG